MRSAIYLVSAFAGVQLSQALQATDLDLKKHGDGAKPPLPSVKKVTEKSTKMVSSIGSKLADLEKTVASAQHDTSSGMQKQKLELESKLAKQGKTNTDLDRSNKKLSMQIRSIKSSNAIMHTEAKSLVESNEELRSKLTHLSGNLTLFQEFAQDSHDHSGHDLVNASQVSVLFDLEAEDKSRNEAKAQESRFKSVEDSMDAVLMQVDAETKPSKKEMIEKVEMKDKVALLLKNMQSTLKNVESERNSSAVALQAKFDTRFEKGEARHQELLVEQGELNATYVEQVAVAERLHVAVDHLRASEKDLKTKSRNLFLYLQRVSGSKTAEPVHMIAGHKKMPAVHSQQNKAVDKRASAKHHTVKHSTEQSLSLARAKAFAETTKPASSKPEQTKKPSSVIKKMFR